MHLAKACDIRSIDRYAVETLGLSVDELIRRSGCAVARVVRRQMPSSTKIVVLAGKGNNGADGYAAAVQLKDYDCTVIDVFDHPSSHRSAFEAEGGRVLPLDEQTTSLIASADVLIDAIFGTGFHGQIPPRLYMLCDAFRTSSAYKIAVDIPLGVDADLGRVQPQAWRVDATVVLSFMKAGLVSYPGRAYVGELIQDPIGLPTDRLAEQLTADCTLLDSAWVRAHLPSRAPDANKASFGHAVLYTGSAAYRGAAHLSLAATLRSGVGYTHFVGDSALVDSLVGLYPEALYHAAASAEQGAATLASIDARATLIGCGCGCTEDVYRLVRQSLAFEDGTLILDADAINALCRFGSVEELKGGKCTVVLTPHPKEFSRMCGQSVEQIQADRLYQAQSFARTYGVILVLKGAATIVTDGAHTYINPTGSTALAKAGSGDVLAGLICGLCAQREAHIAAACAVYLHGAAADTLSACLTDFGVTPSDLPRQIGKEINAL